MELPIIIVEYNVVGDPIGWPTWRRPTHAVYSPAFPGEHVEGTSRDDALERFKQFAANILRGHKIKSIEATSIEISDAPVDSSPLKSVP